MENTKIFHGVGVSFTMAELIQPGKKFDTEFENGCVVSEQTPDSTWVFNNLKAFSFDAADSEGVICNFSSQMVTRIY